MRNDACRSTSPSHMMMFGFDNPQRWHEGYKVDEGIGRRRMV